jgi:hypothetical protein
MTNNPTATPNAHESEKIENKNWIEKILHLRAYLEQEQEATTLIYQNYQTAQAELSLLIEEGNQHCLDLKAEYLQKIEALNQAMSQLRYDVSREIEKLRQQLA